MFNFIRNCQFSKMNAILHSHQQCMTGQFGPNAPEHWVIVPYPLPTPEFWPLEQVYSAISLWFCIPLMANDIEHLSFYVLICHLFIIFW